ncbi:homoserine acetyltransferase [Aquimarina atlantica]|uniref:Homoserine acetyltransferase n=1 Tax=Aquimarina atlantica TaxID=1317122 RepID=A0A023BWU5_9FLAO|nr:alpha/beta fold hydrolase [Aquimarina atlantica]EZH74527.1 homoserine acetyltransferase [Aquimarina atlantica]
MLQELDILNYTTIKGRSIDQIHLTYEVFGKPLYTAPIVLVNHALTGNSAVCGEHGWWNGLIGKDKCIDTNRYTVLSFNIPGNGYDGKEENLIEEYKIFNARDIAAIFSEGLKLLKIDKLHAVIGGSVGGGIAWELAALNPSLITHLIPVATDWKSTDWLKANCLVQEQILLNSKDPVHDARLHAMLIYRSPESFKQKFNRTYNDEKDMYNIESWLLYHGEKLDGRFALSAYKELNHILANIDITKGRGDFDEVVASIQSNIHIISVDSDIFFTAEEDRATFKKLKRVKQNVTHKIINSVHGHDAFLIEFEQLNALLKDVF